MKRRAYIGLSTPLFYDYSNSLKSTNNALSSSPNPILDSPYGLFLLYDEIWFLCEELCPKNLRDATFVKFLDKENMLPNLNCIMNTAKKTYRKNKDGFLKRNNYQRKAFKDFNKTALGKGIM